MIYADKRNIEPEGQRLCITNADEQRPDKARSLSDGDSVDIGF